MKRQKVRTKKPALRRSPSADRGEPKISPLRVVQGYCFHVDTRRAFETAAEAHLMISDPLFSVQSRGCWTMYLTANTDFVNRRLAMFRFDQESELEMLSRIDDIQGVL